MDYAAFWIPFLIPLVIGFVSGWWLKGVKQRDDEALEIAKWRHPAFRQQWHWED